MAIVAGNADATLHTVNSGVGNFDLGPGADFDPVGTPALVGGVRAGNGAALYAACHCASRIITGDNTLGQSRFLSVVAVNHAVLDFKCAVAHIKCRAVKLFNGQARGNNFGITCRVRNLEYAEACLGRSGVSEASQLGIGDVKRTGGDLKIDLRAVRFACDGLSVADNGDVLGNRNFFGQGYVRYQRNVSGLCIIASGGLNGLFQRSIGGSIVYGNHALAHRIFDFLAGCICAADNNCALRGFVNLAVEQYSAGASTVRDVSGHGCIGNRDAAGTV